jgi:hypothetical protein
MSEGAKRTAKLRKAHSRVRESQRVRALLSSNTVDRTGRGPRPQSLLILRGFQRWIGMIDLSVGTLILPEHRLRQIAIAPPDIRIKYVVIDRPLADKLRDAGWRIGRGIVEKYDGLFPAQVAAALQGGSADPADAEREQRQLAK